MVYTFWEGPMPEYIKLCMETWKFDYKVLDYNTLHDYTDLQVHKLMRFTLPQIADVVRVHVLRDQGGVWLDTDTIMIGDELPEENMIGSSEERTNTIGYLRTEKGSDMYKEWADWQDTMLEEAKTPARWDVMGNAFTDYYVMKHPEITIADVSKCWAEVYMVKSPMSRVLKYQRFYFEQQKSLKDLLPTNMLMLHNSWTPGWYKQMSREEILKHGCTLSNILREVL